MSEANAPFNRPNPSDSSDSSFSEQDDLWANPFLDALLEMDEDGGPSVETFSVGVGHGGVNVPDPSNGSSLDSGHSSASVPSPASSSSDSVTLAPGTENWLNSSEPTDLTDLISLIQELNQCNSILLDRVSQLEEALERSQNALKAEVKRSHDQSAFADFNSEGVVAAQELADAQEQIVNLYNQLEFVHQTSQRQQILIETLTGQLETSQERVAELEREAALVQQRYNEQSQVLAQYENNCRDLQARLHRQQRYTLQFKVALEKSLEMSTPQSEPVAEVVAAVAKSNENLLLPKTQHIKPWSAHTDFSASRFPWMKLSSDETPDEATDLQSALNENEMARSPFGSRFSSVKLPGFGNPIPRPASQALDANSANGTAEGAAEPRRSAVAPVSYNLVQPSNSPDAVSDEALMQRLDEVVRPLADMLAEVVLADSAQPGDVPPNAANPANTTSASGVAGVGMAKGHDFGNDFMADDASMQHAADSVNSSDDALLNSVMADAEDALWQDLARLIDVSTEDIVKASLSGDVSAFESINFDAVQSASPQNANAQNANSQNVNPEPALVEGMPQDWMSVPEDAAIAFADDRSMTKPQHAEPRHTSPSISPEAAPAAATRHQPAASDAKHEGKQEVPVFTNSSSPSPLVYPLRPQKKRRSLAAVDLPSFLQQPQPGPLPT